MHGFRWHSAGRESACRDCRTLPYAGNLHSHPLLQRGEPSAGRRSARLSPVRRRARTSAWSTMAAPMARSSRCASCSRASHSGCTCAGSSGTVGKRRRSGPAVLHAASLARFRFIGYWDADLSTPLDEVEHLLEALHRDRRCQLALGSRVKRLGSTHRAPAARHALGRIFAACASGVLGVSVYDSQCGAKIFRAEVVPTLFGKPFLTRWLFDLEMLARLRNEAGAAVEDMTDRSAAARWREVGGSKLKLRDMINVPRELLTIRRHYQSSSRTGAGPSAGASVRQLCRPSRSPQVLATLTKRRQVVGEPMMTAASVVRPPTMISLHRPRIERMRRQQTDPDQSGEVPDQRNTIGERFGSRSAPAIARPPVLPSNTRGHRAPSGESSMATAPG